MRLFWFAITSAVIFSSFIVLFVHSNYETLSLRDLTVGAIAEYREEVQQVTESTTTPKILFVGDVMLARDVERLMDAYGEFYPHQFVSDLYHSHTYVFVNFEASIPEKHTPTPDLTFSFSVNEEYVLSLASYGITHLSTANNHSLDYGSEGFVHTNEVLRNAGTHPFGAPYTVSTSSVAFVSSASTTVAVIGLDLTMSGVTEEELRPIFQLANSESDMQVVFVHWGTEYEVQHSDTQENYAQGFIALGADVIIGHHPHVVQDIAIYDGVPVFYSLGNFIFDQFFDTSVQQGLALSLNPSERTIELIPISTIGTRNAPHIMPSFERDTFLETLAKSSEKLLQGDIRAGVLRF